VNAVPFAWVTALAVATGTVHLAAYYRGARLLAGLAKAVPIALLLTWVLTVEPAAAPAYRGLVATGLLFSMGGDLLLLSRARFRAGLASFFVGHVCYALAFTAGSPGFAPSPWLLVLLVAVAAVILRTLWPHVVRERVPVACYVAMISLMAWTAAGRALAPETSQPSGVLAALGALVFMTSDAILAFDRFARPWPGAHAAVMVTYYAAQILIAASVAA
jgi:uncharacterized membrane protein YhhN